MGPSQKFFKAIFHRGKSRRGQAHRYPLKKACTRFYGGFVLRPMGLVQDWEKLLLDVLLADKVVLGKSDGTRADTSLRNMVGTPIGQTPKPIGYNLLVVGHCQIFLDFLV
jgi:hypothetical protein